MKVLYYIFLSSASNIHVLEKLKMKTKLLIYVKLVLISDTYCILIFAYPYCYPFKKLDLS